MDPVLLRDSDLFEFEGKPYELYVDGESWWVKYDLRPCTVRDWRRPGFYEAALACRKALLSKLRQANFRAILGTTPNATPG